ncbi:28S ribosomal protein S18a, mitochondrial [Phlebotomus papatasi]|uniref:Large ribosomal subunit protein mL66 n=1 Tax=Phlebotomus papatasi TaxID=29031 RepID=A0A1B0D9A2_PHLPP|nr:28S ribosomal protein S18a, mitochondrial [Phlebotomus papatasi]
MNLFRLSTRSAVNLIQLNINQFTRPFTGTAVNCLKEIKTTQDEKNTVKIEGILVKSPRDEFLLKEVKEARACGKGFCPKCSIGLDVKHTDVLILSQYVRSDGCMLPRRVTGLCSKQQKKMRILVAMAQKAGLMPNLAPDYSKKDPKKRMKWKKFNIYFEEEKVKEIKYL